MVLSATWKLFIYFFCGHYCKHVWKLSVYFFDGHHDHNVHYNIASSTTGVPGRFRVFAHWSANSKCVDITHAWLRRDIVEYYASNNPSPSLCCPVLSAHNKYPKQHTRSEHDFHKTMDRRMRNVEVSDEVWVGSTTPVHTVLLQSFLSPAVHISPQLLNGIENRINWYSIYLSLFCQRVVPALRGRLFRRLSTTTVPYTTVHVQRNPLGDEFNYSYTSTSYIYVERYKLV